MLKIFYAFGFLKLQNFFAEEKPCLQKTLFQKLIWLFVGIKRTCYYEFIKILTFFSGALLTVISLFNKQILFT